MNGLNNVRRWIEAGKQVGKHIVVEKNGENHWLTAGIQKWDGIYKLYISEIEESLIPGEEYLVDEINDVQHFEELAPLMAAKTLIKLEELTPLKGNKAFHPPFDAYSITDSSPPPAAAGAQSPPSPSPEC
ncbi:hypothetical protein [Hymenobacter daeguensis]